MGAMLGVVLADNLLLLVVFWELTSLASFLLIGFWQHRADARQGARMALAVTGAGGLCLLGGVLLLGHIAGSFELDAVLAAGRRDPRASRCTLPALVLVLLGAFTKIGAVPVPLLAAARDGGADAGVGLPALGDDGEGGRVPAGAAVPGAGAAREPWFWIVVGAWASRRCSFGAFVAIFQHDLKGLLAYSTISHLGLITLLFGLDSPLAVGGRRLPHPQPRDLQGLAVHGGRDHRPRDRHARHAPAQRALVGACRSPRRWRWSPPAAMAGVPLLNGFLSKEMFFAETLVVESHRAFEWIVPDRRDARRRLQRRLFSCASSTTCSSTASRWACRRRRTSRRAGCACRWRCWSSSASSWACCRR